MNPDIIKLLLIEDDIVDQMAFKRMVKSKKLPYKYQIANTVSAAKDLLQKWNFDVIIADYNLGDGTAFDVFEFIDDTPCIFTTGAGDEKIAVEAIKSGAYYYHIKDQDRNYLELLPVSIDKALKDKYMVNIQKKAELALKESETKFKAISLAASDAIIMLDHNGTVQFWNHAAETIFGYSEDEALAKNLDKLILPKNSEKHYLNILKSNGENEINSALGERIEMKAQTKKGKNIFIELSISGVNLKGQLNSIVIIRDITENKEAEEKLRQSKERLDIILHNIGNGVIAINSDQQILFVNERTYDLLGFPEGSQKPTDLRSILINCEKKGKVLLNSIGKTTFNNLEINVIEPFQRVLYVTVTSFCDTDGKIAGKILILADVTEEKEIEKMKADFVSNVTHELRTPITSIKGFTKMMLMNDNLSDSKRQEFLEIIFKESSRLSDLIEDILSISKIESGKVDYKFEKVSIAAIIELVYNIFKLQAAKKDIILTCDIDENLLDISADQDAIHQVAVNLLDNALKFTSRGGTIKLSLYSRENQIIFSIEDDGLGIPVKNQKNIFNKFYRVRRPGIEIPGTGLGLSIVKQIVALHNGKIKLESEEGSGSKFTVSFPQAIG
jgi:PAS domain S-box-containing protein